MEDLINQLVERVGIDKATAEKVVAFLKEHASEVPKWLGQNEMLKGAAEKLGGKFGGMFGK